jgi:hypothetical protein
MTDFVIPAPYRAWCHPCKQGFMSIAELSEHNRTHINKHQQINAEEQEKKNVPQKTSQKG